MKKLLKSKIFWIIIIVLLLAGAVSAKFLFKSEAIEYITQKVIRGNVVQTVSATGKVKSASEIELNFKNTGKLSILNVDVGDKVERGQVLAQLRANDLAISVSKSRANLEEEIANLEKLKAGAISQDIAVYEAVAEKANTDLLNAQIGSENTEAIYNQALENEKQNILVDIAAALTKANISLQEVYDTLNYEGDDDNFQTSNFSLEQTVNNGYDRSITEVDEAQLAYNLAKLNSDDDELLDDAVAKSLAALSGTSEILDSLSRLLDYVIINSVLTRSKVDALKTTINTERVTTNASITAVQSAKQDLADAKLNYQTKVEEAANTVKVEEKNLAKAEADLNFKKAPARTEDIALYEARVKRAQADLYLAQDKYDETIIRAPIAGIITDVNFNVGEQTALAEPVIAMLAEENYEIEVDIPESDIVKIGVSDETEITFDAFADEDIFKGIIITINPAQTEIQDVVYYRVTAAMAEDQPAEVAEFREKIKPGMTANVTIKTAEVNDVLIIPLRAVKEKDGRKVVQVLGLEAKEPQLVEVVLGPRGDEGLVEVKSGLVEGQSVVTFVRNGK